LCGVKALPIYEYECSACHSRFERKQRFDEEPIASCPHCSGRARRLIHSVPVVFKGSGFYCTDYGRGSSCSSPGKCRENDTESKPATGTEKKGDAKCDETKCKEHD
jgi:putative FmdB family regulatory protein